MHAVADCAPLGYSLASSGKALKPMHFQRLIDRMKGTPEERPIAALMLRTMQKARYDAVSLGHFGLAAEHYTHFTSPIRRYPDLVVHRMLRQSRRGPIPAARLEELEEELPETAKHTSDMERRADDAERELLQWKKVWFMADKVGDEHGPVTASRPSACSSSWSSTTSRVSCISSMADDYYRFVEQQHAALRRKHEEDLSPRRQGGGAGGAGRPRGDGRSIWGSWISWKQCATPDGRGRCAAGSRGRFRSARARDGRSARSRSAARAD
jgi:exoribonuclease R